MARITSVYVLLASAIVGMCAAPVVNLGYAQYQGVLDSTSGNTHFLGMRYAAPPTGMCHVSFAIRACTDRITRIASLECTCGASHCLRCSTGSRPATEVFAVIPGIHLYQSLRPNQQEARSCRYRRLSLLEVLVLFLSSQHWLTLIIVSMFQELLVQRQTYLSWCGFMVEGTLIFNISCK